MHQMVSFLPFLIYCSPPHLLKTLASDSPLVSTETQLHRAAQLSLRPLNSWPPYSHCHTFHFVTTSIDNSLKTMIPKSLEARGSRNWESGMLKTFQGLLLTFRTKVLPRVWHVPTAQSSPATPLSHTAHYSVLPTSWASLHLRGLFQLPECAAPLNRVTWLVPSLHSGHSIQMLSPQRGLFSLLYNTTVSPQPSHLYLLNLLCFSS